MSRGGGIQSSRSFGRGEEVRGTELRAASQEGFSFPERCFNCYLAHSHRLPWGIVCPFYRWGQGGAEKVKQSLQDYRRKVVCSRCITA